MTYYVLIAPFVTGLFVLSTVLIATTTRLPSLVRYYRISCWSLGILCLAIAYGEGSTHLVPVAVAIITIKGLMVPYVISHFARRTAGSLRLLSTFRPTPMWFFSVLAISGASFLAIQSPFIAVAGESYLLPISISTVFIGLIIMMTRRDVLSQMVGFLVMENGITLFSISAIGGISVIIEAGIYSVVLIGAVLMASLSSQVQELYGSSDTSQLTELID